MLMLMIFSTHVKTLRVRDAGIEDFGYDIRIIGIKFINLLCNFALKNKPMPINSVNQ